MWSLLERGKKVIFALIFSIIPLVLLYVQSKDAEIRSTFARPVTEISGFVQRASLVITGGVSDFFYRYFFLAGRAEELTNLRAQIQRVRTLEARVENLMNERAALMELHFRATESAMPAGTLSRVIARAGAPMARMIRLDKGSLAGIKPKSPVIAYDGVVGQVLNVSRHFSDVLLVTDASFAVDAKIVGSDARGLLRGITNNAEYMMEIRDIDGLLEVSAGNIVVTSGVNSNFPSGIPIGTVVESFRSRDGLFVSARIEPFVFMDRLSNVLVLNLSDGDNEIDPLTAAWPMAVQ
jgi:rod shape-determining protein MreC